MQSLILAFLTVLLSPPRPGAAPFETPPDGFTLMAEDDCGDPYCMPHVVRGKEFVFSPTAVTGSLAERDIVFDDDFCLLRDQGLNATAAYKVDVVYVTEAAGSREQSLEANGLPVHDVMLLPADQPGRFIFEPPRDAYANGKPVELKFARQAGANAVISYVRIWSTDPQPLKGQNQLWMPDGPIEKDWMRQDRLRGKPTFGEWEDPVAEVRDNVIPCIDEQLARGRSMLADLRRLNAEDLDQSRAELTAVARQRDALVEAESLKRYRQGHKPPGGVPRPDG